VGIPWVQKYKPKKLEEIVGNREVALAFGKWLRDRLSGRNVKPAALLHGPPGVGKTLTVEIAAQQFNLELVELNASDFRTKEAIERIAGGAAMQASLFGYTGKLIFLDEIDGITSEDRGGIPAVVELVKYSRFPVVLTANDPWDPSFRELRGLCEMFKYDRIRSTSIVAYLRQICKMEGITPEDEALKAIAEHAEGDVRAALNDLQMVAQGAKKLTKEMVMGLYYRTQQQSAFEVLRRLFSAKTAITAKMAMEGSLVDFDTLIKWINENIPYQYEDVEELSAAYDALSKADIYYARVKRSQNWDLFKYVIDFATAGVALAKRKPFKFVKYQFPKDILMLSATKEERTVKNEILSKIRERCHISRRRATIEYLPYLQLIFSENPEVGHRIAKELKLSKEAIDYLSGRAA